MAGDTVRFAQREHRVTLLIGQCFAVQLIAGASVELEVARAGGGIGARLFQRLAAVARFELRQFLR